MMANNDLQNILDPLRPLGLSICASLARELDKLGLAEDQVPRIDFDAATFGLRKDPYTGAACLRCDWYNHHNLRQGSIEFNSDGSFFAEYDVVHPHPTDQRWFIEAVTAWGRDGEIKSEARLLPAVGQ